MEILNSFLLELLILLGDMAPYLILGFVLAGLLHAFIPKSVVVRHLGKESAGSAVKAALLGVPMPLCSCGVIPTGIGLLKRGASRAAVVSFFIATPQTGLDNVMITYGLLGGLFAVFTVVSTFLSGIVGGIATLLLKSPMANEQHWQQYHVKSEDALEQVSGPLTLVDRLRSGLRFAFVDLLRDISTWLVLGLVVAALISLFVPADFFSGNLGSGIGTKLLMMVFGIPLYVCSAASVPIAAVLMTKGVSAGAAFVFLMTGPATNAATMIIIGRVMGTKVLAVYLGSIALLALGFGILLDFIVQASGQPIIPSIYHDHTGLGAWITWLSAGLLTFFIVLHSFEKLARKFSKSNAVSSMNTMDLEITGMNCSHCVRAVTDSLKTVPGVTNADVSLDTGYARVTGDALDRALLVQAVESVGYGVKTSPQSATEYFSPHSVGGPRGEDS